MLRMLIFSRSSRPRYQRTTLRKAADMTSTVIPETIPETAPTTICSVIFIVLARRGA